MKKDDLKISKTAYIKGLQCPKALWYYTHRRDLIPEVSPGKQAIFDTGHEIGKLAQSYFPGGVEITDPYYKTPEGIASTKKAVKESAKVIFEACARSKDGAYARIDVLKKVKDKFDLIEVKSSTRAKYVYLNDLALQYYVFKSAGYKIRKASLMYINNKFVKNGEINPKEFFIIEDVTEKVLELQPGVKKMLALFFIVINRRKEPDVSPGSQCTGTSEVPYTCDFYDTCWKDMPDHTVWDFFSKKSKTLKELLDIGIVDAKDIPAGIEVSESKSIELLAFKHKKTFFDKNKIKEFLSTVEYPLYFLDYETTGPAIPEYDGTRPYDCIPFQFSLHIQKRKGGKLTHIEFLNNDSSDPRKPLVKALTDAIDEKGTVVAYCMSFEKGVNDSLAKKFPKYSKALKSINERMIDLLVPFRKKALYHPGQRCSNSLKYTLPAFIPKMSYENLNIQEGGMASLSYQTMIDKKTTPEQKAQIYKDLLEYCKQDTLAMVKLLEILYEKLK